MEEVPLRQKLGKEKSPTKKGKQRTRSGVPKLGYMHP